MSTGSMNRRDAAGLVTRGSLLAAARASFGTFGYANASLAQISRDAGATTGALYHHFADKKVLFTAVAEDVEAEIVASLVAGAPKTNDLWELVSYAVTETLEVMTRPGLATIIFKDAPTVIGPAAWREIEMRYGFGQLHALLGALATAGRLGTHDPAIVAGIVLGASIQTVDAILSSNDPRRTLDAGKAAMLAMLAAFRADAPRGEATKRSGTP